jgi:hypothetical protein
MAGHRHAHVEPGGGFVQAVGSGYAHQVRALLAKITKGSGSFALFSVSVLEREEFALLTFAGGEHNIQNQQPVQWISGTIGAGTPFHIHQVTAELEIEQ